MPYGHLVLGLPTCNNNNRTLGMYSLIFMSTPSPSPSFASAEWGPSHAVPPVGSPGEHRRAWPLGSSFPCGALASPPSSCGLAPHRHAPPALISWVPPAGRLSRAPRNLGGLPRSEGGLCRSHQSEKTIPPGS
ncbi:hypothetical protein COCOBI_11-1630 [Coccomyxa sp. Obi]|nr:hypothetical protein COCOBI_11-1530 [Coccomyxa sp. Obi]BDA47901.1 hypothetical protein COCOBI_11-1580 [Coccomyxa sp. Obi]BDA47906.1 hypothetical protein COCOBI_11-1630 [Coccomyxa sp. Obi]